MFSIKNEKIPHENPDLKLKKTRPKDLAILAAQSSVAGAELELLQAFGQSCRSSKRTLATFYVTILTIC